MKPRTLVLILATALPAALALPVVASSLSTTAPQMVASFTAITSAPRSGPGPLLLASNDDNEGGWFGMGRDHDDEGTHENEGCASDHGDDNDDDDGACATTGAATPAPAGSVAPPANGLFAPGSGPVVSMN